MKKIMLIALMSVAFTSYGQVGKQDFENILLKFKFETMSSLFISNVHIYNADGTNEWTYYDYQVTETAYELKENAFYIYWYTDKTKKVMRSIFVIPYNRINTMSVTSWRFTIDMIE